MITVREEKHFSARIALPFGIITTEETSMVRLRLATLAVAAGCGLVCGCMSMSQCGLLGRLRARMGAECCDHGAVANGEGPIVDGPMMNGGVPSDPIVGPIPPVTPQNTIPPLASPPRIVPQPQAQPAPYTP
jgi:hypothetical protein